MIMSEQVMPQGVWHHVGMDEERRKKLRRLGRVYRAALEAERTARLELAAEVLAAVDRDKEQVGEVAREIGFDREWIRRARKAEADRKKKAAAEESGDS